MFKNFVFVVLLIQTVSRISYGQLAEKFFRKDYTFIEETQSFYKVHTLQKTWDAAKAKCEVEGASLFYPEDEDEALAVIAHWNTTQPTYHWVFIGISDWNVKEVFETIDGRPVADVYNNWGYGEPNNAGNAEGCVILRRDATLNDDKCQNQYPFVCKKSLATLQWNTPCNIPDINYIYAEKLDRCYKFHSKPRNWTEAHGVCSSEQSYLAVINSDMERDHLVNVTANAPKDFVGDYLYGGVHLGFHNKNGWITVKGIPLQESGYSNWAFGQPDGAMTENCGSMFFTGELNDIGCFQKMFFICEHEIQIRTEDIVYKYGDEENDQNGQNDQNNQKDHNDHKKIIAAIFGTPAPKPKA